MQGNLLYVRTMVVVLKVEEPHKCRHKLGKVVHNADKYLHWHIFIDIAKMPKKLSRLAVN
jgi:hypothetical protein